MAGIYSPAMFSMPETAGPGRPEPRIHATRRCLGKKAGNIFGYKAFFYTDLSAHGAIEKVKSSNMLNLNGNRSNKLPPLA